MNLKTTTFVPACVTSETKLSLACHVGWEGVTSEASVTVMDLFSESLPLVRQQRRYLAGNSQLKCSILDEFFELRLI